MIEQLAHVASIAEPGHVILRSRTATGCALCERGQGCGGGVLGKLIQRQRGGLQLPDPGMQLSAGDLVVVGIAESAFLRSIAGAYLLPVLSLLVGAGVAGLLGLGEPAIAIAGLMGLIVGLGLGWQANAKQLNYRPRILRRANAVELAACAMDKQ